MTSATAVRERAVSLRATIAGHGSWGVAPERLAGASRIRSSANPARVFNVAGHTVDLSTSVSLKTDTMLDKDGQSSRL